MQDEAIRAVLSGHPGVLFAYVYGSENPHTDLDIALYLSQPPTDRLSTEAEWASELQAVAEQPVDVFVLNYGPLEWAYAAQKGRLIWEKDRDARILFETTTRKAYWDWVPKLRVLLDHDLKAIRNLLHASRGG